jgi:hypothetical protein
MQKIKKIVRFAKNEEPSESLWEKRGIQMRGYSWERVQEFWMVFSLEVQLKLILHLTSADLWFRIK